jgi:hypothetical protein
MSEHADVQAYLAGVTPDKRRRDSVRLVEIMARATGQQPAMGKTAVGFGRYHYMYESGREGDGPAAAFAARKAALTIYLPDGVRRHQDQLESLGPHTTGVGCLYIKDLDLVDLTVLEAVIAESYRNVTHEPSPFPERDVDQAGRLT